MTDSTIVRDRPHARATLVVLHENLETAREQMDAFLQSLPDRPELTMLYASIESITHKEYDLMVELAEVQSVADKGGMPPASQNGGDGG